MKFMRMFWPTSLCVLASLGLAGCRGVVAGTIPPTPAAVTVTVSGGGTGTVTSLPVGINCPTTCTANFNEGTQVTLSATPGTSYTFTGWSGVCSGTASCTFTVTAQNAVTADFAPIGPVPAAVTVTLSGGGAGTVTSTPAGINCPTTCTANFNEGTQVALSETPGAVDTFAGWGGLCSGTAGCSLTVAAQNAVTADFAPITAGLVVTLAGGGTGTVTSSPAGINCPTTCSANFNEGTQVTLTETPGTNYVFAGWSGLCSGTSGCSLTVGAQNGVTAAFGGSLQSINHIILFAQENRSFDHYFGYLRQYWANNGIPDQPFDGLPQFTPASQCTTTNGVSSCAVPTNPACDPTKPPPSACVTDPTATPVPTFHMQSVCTEELSPFWNEAHVDWNDNFLYPSTIDWKGNGFVEAGANDARQYYDQNPPINDVNGYRTMGYFTDADLNYYYFMASNFSTSDRWFAPVMSRTELNRDFIYAATSQGHAYPLSPTEPQLTVEPIVQALQAAGITWRIYVEGEGTACATETGDTQSECLLENFSYLNAFNYENTIIASAGGNPDLLQNIRPVSEFASDVQNDQTWPQVIIMEPPSIQELDEHPSDHDQYPVDIQDGAAYAAGLINSLMTSPSWKDSAMIFTFDEPGGFYDHVQPQTVPVPDSYAYPNDLQATDACDGADQSSGPCSFGVTGYRLPLIVISPFAKKNYVSHTVRDTTVWLNFIEERFNIQPLTLRDAYWSTTSPLATMDEFFDYVNIPWATPPSPPAQVTNGTCTMAAPNPWATNH